MKDDVDKLVKLYEEGNEVGVDYFKLAMSIIPNRYLLNHAPPRMVKDGPYGFPRFVQPKEEVVPEHKQTAETLSAVKNFAERWTEEVNSILEKIGKTRYKIRFKHPKTSSSSSLHLGELTKNEEALYETLDSLSDKVSELKSIIFDYEESGERAVVSTDDTEPATYDPKTRTIFFADEAIRFNTNAEYSPAICKLMFEKPDKLWQLKDFLAVWDSLYDYLPDIQKPTDWNKVYDAIKKINARVEKYTDIPDLFKLTTKSVRINPKYIAPSKKQPK
jgi:hypothetical protein